MKTGGHQPSTIHKNSRAPWHNYRWPGAYLITMSLKDRRKLFGEVVPNPQPHIVLSPLGEAIIRDEIPKMSFFYPMVVVTHYCIMPDHIHLIIEVLKSFPPKKQLGNMLNGFIYGVNKAYWRLVTQSGKGIFEKEGYHDQILMHKEQMHKWIEYLNDNPRRLVEKKLHPDLFISKHDVMIAGIPCMTFGNSFLLDVPDKAAVIVHRKDLLDGTFERNKEYWLRLGRNGGVLVSAAIHPKEKEVMGEARENGYCIIYLKNKGFPTIYKPSGRDFDVCAAGRLLQISPWEYVRSERMIMREECLYLNGMAIAIANNLVIEPFEEWLARNYPWRSKMG